MSYQEGERIATGEMTVSEPQDSAVLKKEALDWLLHVTSGHATKADITALERWCAQSPSHAQAFARVSGSWRSIGTALENVAQESSVARGNALRRRAFLGGALAASAAGAALAIVQPPMGLWPSLEELTADYRTVVGEQRRIALDDLVSVELNTRTSLNIRPGSNDGDLIELVVGEAAVETRSKPIEVIAAGGRSRTDDARVNLHHDGLSVCVTCLSGVVVITRRDQEVVLRKDEQISYGDEGFGPVAGIDAEIVTGWRDGDLYFEDEPLANVIDEVNRYRPGKILLVNEALGRRRFTAHFRLERLETVITQLQALFGARVTSMPGGVVLVS